MTSASSSEFERSGWEQAAAEYEECWSDTELFIARLLDAAAVGEGSRLLDVACGPGLVSEAAATRGADPVGMDFAPEMITRARRRCPDLTFVEGDAHQLPFADGSFDSATVNFGIQHLAQPEVALRETRRVLRPGSWLAFTAWVAEGHVADEIIDSAIAAHASPVSVPPGPDPYRFADPEVARNALIEAGFEADSVRVELVIAPWKVPTADFPFEAHLRAGVRLAAILRAQDDATRAAIREAIADGVRPYSDDHDSRCQSPPGWLPRARAWLRHRRAGSAAFDSGSFEGA